MHMWDRESYQEFGAMRDAWLMWEGLNDLDPFVGHPPCYVHERLYPVVALKANAGRRTAMYVVGQT
jgi:hypothetical protein